MKTLAGSAGSALVLCASVWMASSAAAQTPVGALAIDERQGDQYGWAVDYETTGSAQAAALRECGAGCSVVLTFARCAAYAADQDADSTAVGWAESYSSSSAAQQAALGECSSRGRSSGCIVRVWGCNGPVVEDGLGFDRAARQEIQRGLQAAGFDPGGADGMFGPQTRSAIRSWQTSRGARATGYLDAALVASLRPSVAGQPTFREREPPGVAAGPSVPPAAQQQPPAASAELEGLFWQSIMNSTNPAEFEAYLAQFPNGVFRALAEARLSSLRGSAGAAPASPAAGVADPRASGPPATGAVFRPDRTCASQPTGTACWKEVSGRPGCHLWSPYPQPGSTATWTGECVGGLAQGTGTVTWVWDGDRQTVTARHADGVPTGHMIIRQGDGTVGEGSYVDGRPHGTWVYRWADGGVSDIQYVNGEEVSRHLRPEEGAR